MAVWCVFACVCLCVCASAQLCVHMCVCVCYTAFSSVGGSALGGSRRVCWTVEAEQNKRKKQTVVYTQVSANIEIYLSQQILQETQDSICMQCGLSVDFH